MQISELVLFTSVFSEDSMACVSVADQNRLPVRKIRLDTKEARNAAKNGKFFSITSVPSLIVSYYDGKNQLYLGKHKIMEFFNVLIQQMNHVAQMQQQVDNPYIPDERTYSQPVNKRRQPVQAVPSGKKVRFDDDEEEERYRRKYRRDDPRDLAEPVPKNRRKGYKVDNKKRADLSSMRYRDGDNVEDDDNHYDHGVEEPTMEVMGLEVIEDETFDEPVQEKRRGKKRLKKKRSGGQRETFDGQPPLQSLDGFGTGPANDKSVSRMASTMSKAAALKAEAERQFKNHPFG